MTEFYSFPKIPRLHRTLVITEKLDGTNASVYVPEDDGPLLAGSRNRWITPEADNYGFAKWVVENEAELRKLGPGRHFGEWWGKGIQRGYDMDRKVFSLFNVDMWSDAETRPSCCSVVPTLAVIPFFGEVEIRRVMDDLRANGSDASWGYMNPEGIMIYHTAARQYFKYTFEHDAEGKPE